MGITLPAREWKFAAAASTGMSQSDAVTGHFVGDGEIDSGAEFDPIVIPLQRSRDA